MRGAVVLVIVFTVFLALTLGYHDLPPGRQLYSLLGVPETEYPVLGIPTTILVSALFNGTIYGVLVWLIFTFVEKARRKRQTQADKV